MQRIERLTATQTAYLPEFRKQWLDVGMDTNPADKPMTERAIGDLYEWAGFKRPGHFVWMSSPLGCQLYLNMLKNFSNTKPESLRGQLLGQLLGQLRGQLGGQLRDQLGGPLLDQLLGQLEWFPTTNYSYGSLEAYWIAWLRFGQHIGVQYTERPLAGLEIIERISKSCFWWYPFEGFVVISDRPADIVMRDQRLHNESGPSLLFRDGYTLWSIEGVRVNQPF